MKVINMWQIVLISFQPNTHLWKWHYVVIVATYSMAGLWGGIINAADALRGQSWSDLRQPLKPFYLYYDVYLSVSPTYRKEHIFDWTAELGKTLPGR